MINVAINGFGRIGRNFLRAYLKDKNAQDLFRISIINIGNMPENLVAQLFTYDTLMGTYAGLVRQDDSFLYIDDKKIRLISELDATKLPWKSEKVHLVVDCTGVFTKREKAELHLKSGANYVLISAPAHGDDVSIIPGINLEQFDPEKHKIISLGSCTTNAVIPLLFVLNNEFKIENAYMNTIHAYTNSQVLLDVENKDPRRARAAALNIIPTSSGATTMVEKVVPELAGKFDGMSLRVPVAKVSIIDLSFVCEKEISVEIIHESFREFIKKQEFSIVEMTEKPLVSSDFSGNNHSVIIDTLLTKVQGNIGKIFGWYDNEWGYSVRLKDFLMHAASQTK